MLKGFTAFFYKVIKDSQGPLTIFGDNLPLWERQYPRMILPSVGVLANDKGLL